MPAARKARQQMSLDKPTALARRLIIRGAWLQSIGRAVSLRCVAIERRGDSLLPSDVCGVEIGLTQFSAL